MGATSLTTPENHTNFHFLTNIYPETCNEGDTKLMRGCGECYKPQHHISLLI